MEVFNYLDCLNNPFYCFINLNTTMTNNEINRIEDKLQKEVDTTRTLVIDKNIKQDKINKETKAKLETFDLYVTLLFYIIALLFVTITTLYLMITI